MVDELTGSSLTVERESAKRSSISIDVTDRVNAVERGSASTLTEAEVEALVEWPGPRPAPLEKVDLSQGSIVEFLIDLERPEADNPQCDALTETEGVPGCPVLSGLGIDRSAIVVEESSFLTGLMAARAEPVDVV
jgi:hypothetical protein